MKFGISYVIDVYV